jgi:hypothetical protein
LLLTPHRVVHALGDLLRHADAVLSRGAARNAAVSVAVRQARILEDARTLRDLRRVERLQAAAEDGDATAGP